MTLRRWSAKLTDERSDTHTDAINKQVAMTLHMPSRATTKATVEAYIRCQDGSDPEHRKLTIDRDHLAILKRHEICPARFLNAGRLGLGFGVDLLHGDRWTERSTIGDDMAPWITGVVPIMTGIRYDTGLPSSPTFTVDRRVHGHLPDSIETALVGRTLSALFDHGLPRDPRIVRITDMTGHFMVVVEEGDMVAL